MTHKRSRLASKRRLQREQDYYDRQLLRLTEKSLLWDNAYFDEELDEVVNTIICHEHLIHQGEVLLDSRNRGYFQRLT